MSDIREKLGGPDQFPWYANLEREDILGLLDERDAIEAARLRNTQDAWNAWRRVAALEEGLRALLKWSDDYGVRGGVIDKARALLAAAPSEPPRPPMVEGRASSRDTDSTPAAPSEPPTSYYGNGPAARWLPETAKELDDR